MGIGKIKFIDLKDVNFESEGSATIAGIYDTLEGALGEIVCVANISVDGVEKGTAVVSPKVYVEGDDTMFDIQLAGFRFLVSDDDSVFCTELSSVEFPVMPEEDGNYELKLTVSSGVAIPSWKKITD